MRQLIFALAVSALLALGCTGRPRFTETSASDQAAAGEKSYGPGSVVELDLTHGTPESTEAGGLFSLPASRTYTGLLRAIERAGADHDATGLFLRLGAERLGWAQSEELGGVLATLRAKGKPVVCHAHGLENSTMWLAATGCDRVWLSPAGGVDTVGIAAQIVYLKGLLDKLNVKTQILAVGKYKSAAESLTRTEPSDSAREALTFTLGAMRRAWLDGIAAARKNPAVRDSLEGGPWTPLEAKERGLVDEIGFEAEAREDAKERARASTARASFGPEARGGKGLDLAEIIRILAGADERTGGRPHLAVVPAEGSITLESPGLFGSGITARALSKTLDKLANDDAVKAVVLRIDSPGGSPLASDIIWQRLMELRKKKPVVASVGDMAASGGYYIACAANRIIAERTSIVGSIGVFGGKVVVASALEQLGVNAVTIAASPEPGAAARAAYQSFLMPWDEATEQRVRKNMQHIYDLFVSRVAVGRNLPEAKVREHAEGRIWSGEQGKERGLVDDIGGLKRAITLARELGGLDEQAPVSVEGAAESLLELLMLGEKADASEVAAAVARVRAEHAQLLSAIPHELRPFLASTAGLFMGETSVAALPYALVVR